jgi:hypothetical protein
VLASIGTYYTHRTFQLNRAALEHNRQTADRSHALDQARLITERFTRAVDQLGNSSLDVRLGGSMPSSASPGIPAKTIHRSSKS